MRAKPVVIVLISGIVTLIAGFLLLNFMPGEKKIERRLVRKYDVEDAQFRRSMGVLPGPPIVEGNKVEVLLNGEQIFPAMLAAIRGAQRTITFETYIYWSETIDKEFSDALIERTRAGVKVHVMLDFIGSIKMDQAARDAMHAAGIELQRYHKPAWWKQFRQALVQPERRGQAERARPGVRPIAGRPVFNEDWRHTRLITLAEWQARPWTTRMIGKLASLAGAQL